MIVQMMLTFPSSVFFIHNIFVCVAKNTIPLHSFHTLYSIQNQLPVQPSNDSQSYPKPYPDHSHYLDAPHLLFTWAIYITGYPPNETNICICINKHLHVHIDTVARSSLIRVVLIIIVELHSFPIIVLDIFPFYMSNSTFPSKIKSLIAPYLTNK